MPRCATIDGILYCNDGDWVESLTALAEHADGTLEILHWAQQRAAGDQARESGSVDRKRRNRWPA